MTLAGAAVIGGVAAASKRRGQGLRRQADRDDNALTSHDDFRIRSSPAPPLSKPVTNGTISQHPVMLVQPLAATFSLSLSMK